MSCGNFVVMTELRAGARLFRYEQQAGGHVWALTGARITPASLDKICDQMLADGWLVEGDERQEYVPWQRSTTR